jgi:hypothetical protein
VYIYKLQHLHYIESHGDGSNLWCLYCNRLMQMEVSKWHFPVNSRPFIQVLLWIITTAGYWAVNMCCSSCQGRIFSLIFSQWEHNDTWEDFPQTAEISGLIFQGNGLPLYICDNVHKAVDVLFPVCDRKLWTHSSPNFWTAESNQFRSHSTENYIQRAFSQIFY